jgi:hypothetical protein
MRGRTGTSPALVNPGGRFGAVPGSLPPPDELEPLPLDEGEELTVFRIVRCADLDAPEFADSFRSHAELGLPPRPGSPAASHPLIHEGISVFESQEAAVETARRFPRIGDYVAELRIKPDPGIRYLRWGAKGHLTLWGAPIKLALTAVDTIPV